MNDARMPRSLKTALALPMLLAALTGVGCNSVSGEVGGETFGRITTAFFGEIDYDDESGLRVLLMDHRFSCADLTQRWTPDELDAIPALTSLSLRTYDADEAEFDSEADDYEERMSAGAVVYDDGLEADEGFDLVEGTMTVDKWSEGRSLSGSFEITLEDEDGDEYDLEGSFHASFCRNLSSFED